MKKFLILFLVIATASCKSTKKLANDPAAKFRVETLSGLTAEEIKQKYPEANIKEDVGMFEEGTVEMPYMILYPNTPDEIQITWADAERKKISDIRFSKAGKWSSAEGIKIGTTYVELNSLNGKPISFYGFGWDYSGAVMWNDGKLEKSKLRVFLAPAKDPANKFYGDHIIEASAEEIKDLDLKVQTIVYKL